MGAGMAAAGAMDAPSNALLAGGVAAGVRSKGGARRTRLFQRANLAARKSVDWRTIGYRASRALL